MIASDLAAEALFASDVQPSEDPTAQQIDEAVTGTLLRRGAEGCARHLAQECGDHPDQATERMRWCRDAVHRVYFPVAV